MFGALGVIREVMVLLCQLRRGLDRASRLRFQNTYNRIPNSFSVENHSWIEKQSDLLMSLSH
jgi:hypothetical protein